MNPPRRRPLKAVLLGIKVLDRTDTSLVIKMPFWATDAMITRALANVMADAKTMGKNLRVQKGHKLVRVEWDE